MNTKITLKSLLGDLELEQFKLHCAFWNGSHHPLDVYARSWDEWVRWNSYRPGKNVFNRRYIFSLMDVYGEPGCWLFGGAFEVLERGAQPHSHAYKIQFRPEILPGYVGRLKVRYRLPGRNIRLRFEGAVEQIEVAAILPEPYSGQPFPGHHRINVSLADLGVIFAQERSDWKGALEHMKGVYVLHDRISGKPYVGSAYGDTGIWSRWGGYVRTLHGGNVDLRKLVDREGEAYVRENLMFALLEFWSMRTADDYVTERESYWKEVLMSRAFGLNRN